MRSGAMAVLLGSAVGVVAGFAWQSTGAPIPSAPRESRDVPAKVATVPQTTAAASATNATNGEGPVAVDSAAPAESTAPNAAVAAESASVAPEPSTAAAPSARLQVTPASAPPFPFATPLPPVATKSELEHAEVRCYKVDAEDCGRAADAYDAGTLVPRDAARAENLRKVELTRLVRGCEEHSPHACLVLAGHYESGEGVDENDRHARALVVHARELCHHASAKAECVNGEPK